MNPAAAVATSRARYAGSGVSVLNLLYHADLRYGGIAHSVPALCANILAHSPCRNHLVAVTSPDESFFDPHTAGIPFRRIDQAGPRFLAARRVAADLERVSSEFDVLHVHGIWGPHSAGGCAQAARSRKPYVVSIHGMLTPWALAVKKWRKKVYWPLAEKGRLARASCIRALTYEEAKDIRQTGLRTPVCVVPNGVEPPAEGDAEVLYEELPQLRGATLTLFLSRLQASKGPELLCRAWAAARPANEHHLLIAGPGEAAYAAHLRRVAREIGIGDRVHFLGMTTGKRKAAALRASSFFVLPSESEGLSNAILEAMAAGLVPIVTEGCRFPEAESCGAGVVVRRETGALAAALSAAHSLPATAAAEMGARGKRLIEARYTWKAVVGQMVQVYDWVAGGAAPADTPIV
jgi:glycosyltransferase involved in cell wall biosynthesis